MAPKVRLRVDVAAPKHDVYSVTPSGTFAQGDFVLGRGGLRIQGQTPVAATRAATAASAYDSDTRSNSVWNASREVRNDKQRRQPGAASSMAPSSSSLSSGSLSATVSTVEDSLMAARLVMRSPIDNKESLAKYEAADDIRDSFTNDRHAPTVTTQLPNGGFNARSSPAGLRQGGEDDRSSIALRLEDYTLPLRFEQLKLLDVLGRGTSGVVRRATHSPTGYSLAVKIIPLKLADETARKQIVLELRTLHRSQCEHIVSFFDAFSEEGYVYIALEFMSGGSLADLVARRVDFPEVVLVRIAEHVLSGLDYLHRQLHLVHRDIKPANLLINRAGSVKIGDFGVSGELEHTLAEAKTWVGTAVYMSPERIKGNSYGAASDIWAFGLSLFECAQGTLPFDFGEPGAAGAGGVQFWTMMDEIVNSEVPRLKHDEFSSVCANFVELCLQKDPKCRPSAGSLLQHDWIERDPSRESERLMQRWLRRSSQSK